MAAALVTTMGVSGLTFQNDLVLQQRSCNNSEELSLKEIKNADLQGSYQNCNRVYQTYLWQQEIVNNLSLHRSPMNMQISLDSLQTA